MEYVILAVVIAVIAVGAVAGLVVSGRRRKELPPVQRPTTIEPKTPSEPQVGDEAAAPSQAPVQTVEEVELPEAAETVEAEQAVEAPAIEVPEPTAGGWCGCARGCRARRTRSARAC